MKVRARPRDETLWALHAQTGEDVSCTGGVIFYGIPTHSHRVVFCIDNSGSMLFPMDGKGGRREPRINRTRRELLRALSDLAPGTLFNVFLFADGESNRGVIVDLALIIEEIAACNAHAAATIHTIGLSQDQNAELLVNLAHRNGGRYVASR